MNLLSRVNISKTVEFQRLSNPWKKNTTLVMMQSEHGSNGNERVLLTPQSSRSGTSPLDVI